ncbi:uncharacterized protein TRAVEDRAFT_61376 [Trametes versicolor FP-101664 SS1]|uniref:uncharacterized protein n=1 Tax=Trametes versicolor (strain FP-101664) TaxID=717944 RepID=UPI0004622659|nr:uncharacterized protein TRAVEDRAFT_61376 [Trametes versicolor FP-101664 SS1]EIW52480.1 hypothetical protein TRAVEDRAFT_61376 [Trametes versicolor FP-101664 SS1]
MSFKSLPGSSGYRRGQPNRFNTRERDTSTLPPDRDLKEGLVSTPLQTLSKPQAVRIPQSGTAIQPERLKYIGSYNWVEEATPTIIVPGSPPVWRNRALPYHVPFDTGVRMVDQNGFRMGSASCLLPLLRAVDIVAEENADTSLDWASVDFVTDRNGLRKLMRWLGHSGTEWDAPLKEFRIDLQLGGAKTVLMHRFEKRTREIAMPPKGGCGINFERESTSPAPGCERSTGHHRIVQYELDGLKMVVRFEVDACTAQPTSSPIGAPARTTRPRTSNDALPSIDSLADALGGLNFSSRPTPAHNASGVPTITVIRAGSQVPQSAVVELVTRSQNYVDQFDWAEQYPQLLLSYTPHLFLGVHNRGTFDRVKKHALGSAELRPVETGPKIQRAFRQLVAILRTIQDLVKAQGQRGRLTLLCQDGLLKVYKRTSNAGCLPEDELVRFGI